MLICLSYWTSFTKSIKTSNRNHTSEAFLSQATVLPLRCHLPDVFKNKRLEKSCDDVWPDSQTAFVGKLGQSRHYTRCLIFSPIYLEKTCVFLSFGLFFSFRGWGPPSEDSLAFWSPPLLLTKKAIIHTVVQLSWVEENTPVWKAAGSLLYHYTFVLKSQAIGDHEHEQSSKHHSSLISISSSCLSVCPDFLHWWCVSWRYELNKPFHLPSCFGSKCFITDVYHSVWHYCVCMCVHMHGPVDSRGQRSCLLLLLSTLLSEAGSPTEHGVY